MRAFAFFDRVGLFDDASRRVSTLDRRADAARGRVSDVDSSARSRLNGKVGTSSRRVRGGRTFPAALGRGDASDDRVADREIYEYPFGRVSPETRREKFAPMHVLAARTDHDPTHAWTQRASQTHWERTGPGQWSDAPLAYPRATRAPGYSNIVPPPPPGLPPSLGRRSVRIRALTSQSHGTRSLPPGGNGLLATRRNETKGNAWFAGIVVALASFALDLPGATARVTREHRAHRVVASLAREITLNPDASETFDGNRNASSFAKDVLVDGRPKRVLGHFAMREAPRRSLRRVEPGSEVLLRKNAAKAFSRMKTHASEDGVTLVPVSGFRDVQRQFRIFFDGAHSRGQTLSERALVSAPPGFSEHHTGYALDISCPEMPGDDLLVSFEHTDAFQWLVANASGYGFEMSFQEDNAAGVSYEPWHWRWVGDEHSRETFEATYRLAAEGTH